ncbi:MAG TPA: FHA domain-containing protein [Chloroflexota bacterium]|nr:FHA domain-containing protein [Chloroflexota bacterium]
MSFAVVVLIARIALVLALYGFLFLVVRAIYRDLRTTARMTASAGPPRAVAGVPQLIVLTVGQTVYHVGQRFPLRNPTMLGRDPACDIPVEDEFVSAQHLKIVLDGGRWVAQDQNSTNGTRLNGARLRGTAPLKPGDILDLGRLRLRFTLDN